MLHKLLMDLIVSTTGFPEEAQKWAGETTTNSKPLFTSKHLTTVVLMIHQTLTSLTRTAHTIESCWSRRSSLSAITCHYQSSNLFVEGQLKENADACLLRAQG